MHLFFYDNPIYRKTWGEHVSDLRVVLQTVGQQPLYVKASKCIFGSGQVDYISWGHDPMAQTYNLEDSS